MINKGFFLLGLLALLVLGTATAVSEMAAEAITQQKRNAEIDFLADSALFRYRWPHTHLARVRNRDGAFRCFYVRDSVSLTVSLVCFSNGEVDEEVLGTFTPCTP